jgi:hypothetical protein
MNKELTFRPMPPVDLGPMQERLTHEARMALALRILGVLDDGVTPTDVVFERLEQIGEILYPATPSAPPTS